MAFDIEKFLTTNFQDRVESIHVPRLSVFFADLKEGEKPEWKVRGLTGLESALAKQSVTENQNISAILSAIGSKVKKDIIEGIKELAGIETDKVPDELVQRYSWLKYGSVDPICDHEMALKIAENFPEDFYLITNKIMQLTGAGRVGE